MRYRAPSLVFSPKDELQARWARRGGLWRQAQQPKAQFIFHGGGPHLGEVTPNPY